MGRLEVVVLLCVLLSFVSAQKKIAFFFSAPLADGGGFGEAADNGFKSIIADYPTAVKVDYFGPDQGMFFFDVLTQ